MKFALFLGCTTPYHLKGYESSSRAVLETLGVELVDVPAFGCCGYPFRNIDVDAFVLASARNLALARQLGLNMLALCKCGYGTLRKAAHMLDEDASIQKQINAILAKEGLRYDPGIEIVHLLSVLHNKVGLDRIREKIVRSYKDLRIATHYGCHALRPSDIVGFDDPVAPTLFDELVTITGAHSVDWPNKLECCGGPLYKLNKALSVNLTKKKLSGARQADAHYLTTACPFCQIQFETVQEENADAPVSEARVPSILYPQLLGLCMGLDKDRLGLDNKYRHIEKFLTS